MLKPQSFIGPGQQFDVTLDIDTVNGRIVSDSISSNLPYSYSISQGTFLTNSYYYQVITNYGSEYFNEPVNVVNYYTLDFPVPTLVGYTGGSLGQYTNGSFDDTFIFFSEEFFLATDGSIVYEGGLEFASGTTATLVPEPDAVLIYLGALIAWVLARPVVKGWKSRHSMF